MIDESEGANRPRLTVLEDGEVSGLETPDGLALLVEHRDVDADDLYAGLERRLLERARKGQTSGSRGQEQKRPLSSSHARTLQGMAAGRGQTIRCGRAAQAARQRPHVELCRNGREHVSLSIRHYSAAR
jgi:hypothetical protein